MQYCWTGWWPSCQIGSMYSENHEQLTKNVMYFTELLIKVFPSDGVWYLKLLLHRIKTKFYFTRNVHIILKSKETIIIYVHVNNNKIQLLWFYQIGKRCLKKSLPLKINMYSRQRISVRVRWRWRVTAGVRRGVKSVAFWKHQSLQRDFPTPAVQVDVFWWLVLALATGTAIHHIL